MTAPGREYDRLIVYRAVLLWLHVFCALTVGIAYLSIQDFSQATYGSRRGSLGVLIIAAIPMLPFWISGYQSRRRVGYPRMAFWTFCLIILLGTGIVGYLYLFEPTLQAALVAVGVSITETVIYLGAIGSCLGNKVGPSS